MGFTLGQILWNDIMFTPRSTVRFRNLGPFPIIDVVTASQNNERIYSRVGDSLFRLIPQIGRLIISEIFTELDLILPPSTI